MERLFAGPYMNGLRQYGIGRGKVAGTAFLSSDPPNPFPGEDWREKLYDLIEQGYVQFDPGDDSTPNLYLFVLPPGVVINAPAVPGETGNHGGFTYSEVIETSGFVAGGVVTTSDLDSTTMILAHEIVEAATNSGEGNAWIMDSVAAPENEIADVCQNTQNRSNGIYVQAYWSDVHNACIIPIAFSLRAFMLEKGLDPSKGLAVVRPPITSVAAFIAAG